MKIKLIKILFYVKQFNIKIIYAIIVKIIKSIIQIV